MASTRRLSAILAADVAGCSRLMGADEEGTHTGLKAVRALRLGPSPICRRRACRPKRRIAGACVSPEWQRPLPRR